MTPIIGITASSITASTLGDFESIATVTVTSATQASIEFTNIPSTYQHLQIRGIMRNNDNTNASTFIQLNSDTGNNYSNHGLSGDGASAISYALTNDGSSAIAINATPNYGSNIFGAAIYNLLEYKNTNVYKTIRCLTGADNNGSGIVRFTSGSWRNTNAVTSILIKPAAGSWVTNSTFALYGIR
jgi:hypothetical protein